MKDRDLKLLGRLNVKIIAVIITITVAVSLFIASFLYSYFYGIEVERVINVKQAEFNNYINDINKIYHDAYRLQQRIAIEEGIQEYISMPSGESAEAEENIIVRNIVSGLSRIMMQYDSISSIALIKNGEISGWTEATFFDEQSKEIRAGWYQAFLDAAEQADELHEAVSRPYKYTLQTMRSTEELTLISIVIPVYPVKSTYNSYGSIIINVEAEALAGILNKGNAFSAALLEGRNGSEVVSIGNTVSLASTEHPGQEFPLVFEEETDLGLVLKVLYEEPPSFRISGKDTLSLTAVMIAALLSIILLIGTTMIYLLRPVKELLTAMDAIGKGNLAVRADVNTGDEFELLGNHLNTMAQKLSENFQDRLRVEREKHEMEYSLLVAQINPHFIYNTLNTVIYLAGRDRTRDVVKITKALIELLQGGIKLSGDRNLSTVDEELTVIRNYVLIQNYRYADKFRMVITCDDRIRNRKIPASIIQPFLENALFHGIVPLKRTGTVSLSIKGIDNNGAGATEILLADDGVGMTEEKIKLLLSGNEREPEPEQEPEQKPEQAQEQSRNHIGITNVLSRLRLLYGDTYRFSIDSAEGKGTRLIIFLPEIEIE